MSCTVEVTYSSKLLSLVKRLNSHIYSDTPTKTVPFYVENIHVGIIQSNILAKLKHYPNVFTFEEDCVVLNKNLSTFEERTKVFNEMLKEMAKQKDHVSLLGWRDEMYDVSGHPNQAPFFCMERAAVSIFGIKAYGSHMNGYVNHPTKGMCLWIARRSATKATYPNKLDNMVAGGISRGIGIHETIIKECEEEAGIPKELAVNAVPVGFISYVLECERGIQRDVQYCFDLEIPLEFVPKNLDGEAQDFRLCTIAETKELIVKEEFKTNCAAVTLDFMIRKGFLLPDEIPDYIEIVHLLRHPLD